MQNKKLQRNAVLKDGDLPKAVSLVAGSLTAGNGQDVRFQCLHIVPAAVEVDPARLLAKERLSRGDLDRRYRTAEGGAEPGGKEKEMGAGGGKICAGDHVVAHAFQKMQTLFPAPFTLPQNGVYRRRTALLNTAQTFFLQRGDAAGFVAGGWIFVDGLSVVGVVSVSYTHLTLPTKA